MIRSGFRFSPPSNETVTAAAFERAIKRALNPDLGASGPGGVLVRDIVGAKEYRAGETRHLAGVTARGETLTVELTKPSSNLVERLSTLWFCAVPPDTPIDHEVDSQWWRGVAPVWTFVLAEMMSTKLRALYQRRKGRDLFDLWLVLTEEKPDPEEIVAGLRHYMEVKVFTYPELAQNLRDKLNDGGFRADLDELVVEMPPDYEIGGAADLVMEQLGSRLDNAPPLDQIAGGAWRA